MGLEGLQEWLTLLTTLFARFGEIVIVGVIGGIAGKIGERFLDEFHDEDPP
jgi:hypothetical protein